MKNQSSFLIFQKKKVSRVFEIYVTEKTDRLFIIGQKELKVFWKFMNKDLVDFCETDQ